MSHHVLAILNQPSTDAPAHDPAGPAYRMVDPDVPQVSALDLAATRGDGIFETISVGAGIPQALEHHLSRFARSAEMLELPAPDLAVWREAILATIAALEPADESFVKTVLTRGIEGDGRPTGWVYGAHSGDFSAARTEGIRVVLLDRGYRHDVQSTSPWLLQGAKSLSYAINRAVFREAARRGADDVVFVSSDGYLLEGPTSTLVYRRGGTLYTPGPDLGILDGTTQANLFRYAERAGLPAQFELGTPDSLRAADAAWLVSSVRLAAPIRAIDGEPFPVDAALSADFTTFLLGLRS